MKRTIAILLALVLTLAALSGCGGTKTSSSAGNAASGNASAGSSSGEADTGLDALDPVELTFSTQASQDVEYVKAMYRVQEKIAEMSGGKLTMVIHDNGSLMTQEGETEGYSAVDHVQALMRHGGAVDVCLYNTKEIPAKLAARYMPEGSEPLMPDVKAFRQLGIRLFGGDMLSRNGQLARHDPLRLAYNVMLCAETFAHREGALGDYDRLLLRKG